MAMVPRFLRRKHERSSSDLVGGGGLGGLRSISSLTLDTKLSKCASVDTLLGTPPPVPAKESHLSPISPPTPSREADDDTMNTATQFALATSAIQSVNGLLLHSGSTAPSPTPSRYSPSPTPSLQKQVYQSPVASPPIVAELPGSLLLENEGFPEVFQSNMRKRRHYGAEKISQGIMHSPVSGRQISPAQSRKASQSSIESQATAYTVSAELPAESISKGTMSPVSPRVPGMVESPVVSNIRDESLSEYSRQVQSLETQVKHNSIAISSFGDLFKTSESTHQQELSKLKEIHAQELLALRTARHFPSRNESPKVRMRLSRSASDPILPVKSFTQISHPQDATITTSVPSIVVTAFCQVSQSTQTLPDPRLEELEHQLRTANMRSDELVRYRTASIQEVEALKSELRAKVHQIHEQKARIESLTTENDKELWAKDEENFELKEKSRSLTRQTEILRLTIMKRDDEIEDLNQTVTRWKRDVDMLEDKIEKLIEDMNSRADTTTMLRELHDAHEALKTEFTAKDKIIEELRSSLEVAKLATPTPWTSETPISEDDPKIKIASLEHDVTKHTEDIRLYKLDVKGYKKDVKVRDRRIAQLESTISELRQQVNNQPPGPQEPSSTTITTTTPTTDTPIQFDVPLGIDLRETASPSPPPSTPSSAHRTTAPSPLMSRFHPNYDAAAAHGRRGSGASTPVSPARGGGAVSPASASSGAFFAAGHHVSAKPSVGSFVTRDGGQSALSMRSIDSAAAAPASTSTTSSPTKMRDGEGKVMTGREGQMSPTGRKGRS